MSGRYSGWHARSGDVEASPGLRDVAKQLLGEIEAQQRLSIAPVPLMTRTRTFPDGSAVEATIAHGIPSVRFTPPRSKRPRKESLWYIYAALDSDEVGVVNSNSGAVVAHVDLAEPGDPPTHFPYDLQLHPTRNEVWVVCNISRHIKIISVPGNEIIARIDLSGDAFLIWKMCFSANGDYAYVSAELSIVTTGVLVIDVATRGWVNSSAPLPDTGAGSPVAFGIAATPDGTRLYVTDHSTQTTALFVLNVGTGGSIGYSHLIPCLPGEVARFTAAVAISRDGTRAVVAHLGWSAYVVDLENDVILGDVDAPTFMGGASHVVMDTLSSNRAWVCARDDETLNLVKIDTITHGGYAQGFYGSDPSIKLTGSLCYGVACRSDGERIYMGRYNARSIVSFSRSPSLIGEIYQPNPTPPHIPEFIAVLNGRPWALCTAQIY